MARSILSPAARLLARVPIGALPVALLLAMAGGCAEGLPGAESVPGSAENLEARLLAAREINDARSADRSLIKLADDAALVGDSVVTRGALAKISDPALRDRTASRCALRLAQGGSRAYAVDIARLIGDPARRDDVMRRLSAALPL